MVALIYDCDTYGSLDYDCDIYGLPWLDVISTGIVALIMTVLSMRALLH